MLATWPPARRLRQPSGHGRASTRSAPDPDAGIRVAGRTHLPGALRSRQGVFESCIRPASSDPHCHERRAFAAAPHAGARNRPVNAAPDQYGVIGHPVAHSWSPFIHGLFARQTGESLVYRLHDVTADEFRNYVLEFFSRGGSGLNVTVPHKLAAADLANELTPRAERAGAVNTLMLKRDNRLLGDNTDGAGLVHDLRDNLAVELRGRRVLIVGAGGATRGVVAPLLVLQPAELVVANRTADRAHAFVADFTDLGRVRGCGFDDIGEHPYDVVINATSASLAGEVPAIPQNVVQSETVCYDM